MKPTDILKQEHRQIERMMNVLEIGAARLAKHEGIAPQFFLNAVQFLQLFADQCHHNKEEKLLFPAMGEHGFPMEGGPIEVMLYEHEEGRGYVRQLATAAKKYAEGDSSAASEINQHVKAFINLLRAHIEKEDNILFVMADVHIPEDAQKNLLDKFNQEETTGSACMQKPSLLARLDESEKSV